MSESKCTRFKVTETGIEINTDCLPMASPKFKHYAARWLYENFPLTKGHKIDCVFEGVLDENTGAKVVVSKLINDDWVEVLSITFDEVS